MRASGAAFVLLACASCAGAGPVSPEAGGPRDCASTAPAELPRSIVVELRAPACAAAAEPGRVCLEGLDAVGPAVIARVHEDGRIGRIAGDPEASIEASDPRAFAGGLRYVRTTRGGDGERRHERVLVSPGGAEEGTEGAAPRPILLGGRALDDPSSEDGLRLAAFAGPDEGLPREAVLWDATRPGAPLARIPLGGARSLSRHPFVSASGDALAVALRRGERTEWVVRGVGAAEVRRRVLADVEAAAPVAVSRDLSWVVMRSAVRGVVVSGPDATFAVPVTPIAAGAFDPCGRWLWLVGGRGPHLLRVELDGGEVEGVLEVPPFIERLEATPDGSLLVASSLPGGAADRPRALILSPFDGRRVEIPLPADLERVSNAF